MRSRINNAIVFAASREDSLPSTSIKKSASSAGTGVFLLLVINLALFAADKLLRWVALPPQ